MNQFQKEVNEVGKVLWAEIGEGDSGLRIRTTDIRDNDKHGDFRTLEVWQRHQINGMNESYIVSQNDIRLLADLGFEHKIETSVCLRGDETINPGDAKIYPPVYVKLKYGRYSLRNNAGRRDYHEVATEQAELSLDEINQITSIRGSLDFIDGDIHKVKLESLFVYIPTTQELLRRLKGNLPAFETKVFFA